MLTNPALAKIVYLNCDVFSLGKIQRKDGAETDPFLTALKKPNFFQTQRQFLWSYRFWLMFGNAYLKPSTKRIDNERGQLYWLNSACIQWDADIVRKLDKMVLSKASYKEMQDLTVKYSYHDGTDLKLRLGDLISFSDLSNNTGNWYKGNSRIDALHKILYNSNSALDAKNINLEFARKFLVSGNYDPSKNLDSLATMQDVEKESIITKLRGNEAVYPIKSQVEIRRFVENLANLQLDDSYNEDLIKVGNMYDVPKEIIDVLKDGSTYENQEKAIMRHINYSEQPKANDLLEGLCEYFEVDVNLYEMTWDDCSFMQVFLKDRAIVNMTNARTLGELIRQGADRAEAAEFLGLDLDFNDERAEQIRQENNRQNQAGQNAES